MHKTCKGKLLFLSYNIIKMHIIIIHTIIIYMQEISRMCIKMKMRFFADGQSYFVIYFSFFFENWAAGMLKRTRRKVTCQAEHTYE